MNTLSICAIIYFVIGFICASLFLGIAYFDSDDSRFHLDMFVSALMLFFLWPIGLYSIVSALMEE